MMLSSCIKILQLQSLYNIGYGIFKLYTLGILLLLGKLTVQFISIVTLTYSYSGSVIHCTVSIIRYFTGKDSSW